MACPHCDAPVVAFGVPDHLREYAPARESAICTRCLRTVAAADPDATPATAPDFSRVDDAFPDGEAGVALALAVGKLESLALNRAAIEALLTAAETAGADVYLFMERLDAPDAAFDVERRREQVLDVFE